MSFWQIIIFVVLFSLTLLPALIALTSKKAIQPGAGALFWCMTSGLAYDFTALCPRLPTGLRFHIGIGPE